jgi:hypothetical protein
MLSSGYCDSCWTTFHYIHRRYTEADIVVATFEAVVLQNPVAAAIVAVVACLRASSSEREVGLTPIYAPLTAPCYQRGGK